MIFPNRRISNDALKLMNSVLFELVEYERGEDHPIVNKARKTLSKRYNKEYVYFTERGNLALHIALNRAGKKVGIPDQGGWKDFKRLCKENKKEIIDIKTKNGIIDSLDREMDALLICGSSGYIAEQPDLTYEIAREKDILIIEDVSGIPFARGDIIFLSTGSPKLINLGFGGVIMADEPIEFRHLLRTNPLHCAGIVGELKNIDYIYELYCRYNDKIRKAFEEMNIECLHKERRGIVTAVKCDNSVTDLFRYKTDLNKRFVMKCPRYERFMGEGLTIELKRLDPFKLTEDHVQKIIDELGDLIEDVSKS